MSTRCSLLLGSMVCVIAGCATARDIVVHEIVYDIPVSPRAVNISSTPLAVCGQRLVTAVVEEPLQSDSNRLLTVVHLGERDSEGQWQWQREVIEPRTLPDPYHTQPSVGVDRQGRVHVAYNMHNMPWQYVVSREPCSIDAFDFAGEAVTDAELHAVFEENRTPFPGLGAAAIPGNQVTYPVFSNDRAGNLYVSYRFAVRPARAWLERAFGAGIARFDDESRRWEPVGGLVTLSSLDVVMPPDSTQNSVPDSAQAFPFAWQPGWTSYYPRLWFDPSNDMHVAWTWREGEAGVDASHPSYAVRRNSASAFQRADDSYYSLPITVGTTGTIDALASQRVYAGLTITTDYEGAPLIVVQPVNSERLLARFDRSTQRWHTEASPFGATSVLCEDNGDCWAYASGPRVLLKRRGETRWKMMFEQQGYCDPKPLHDVRSQRRFLYITRCDQRSARILEITG
jgi:hypothetical protein